MGWAAVDRKELSVEVMKFRASCLFLVFVAFRVRIDLLGFRLIFLWVKFVQSRLLMAPLARTGLGISSMTLIVCSLVKLE